MPCDVIPGIKPSTQHGNFSVSEDEASPAKETTAAAMSQCNTTHNVSVTEDYYHYFYDSNNALLEADFWDVGTDDDPDADERSGPRHDADDQLYSPSNGNFLTPMMDDDDTHAPIVRLMSTAEQDHPHRSHSHTAPHCHPYFTFGTVDPITCENMLCEGSLHDGDAQSNAHFYQMRNSAINSGEAISSAGKSNLSPLLSVHSGFLFALSRSSHAPQHPSLGRCGFRQPAFQDINRANETQSMRMRIVEEAEDSWTRGSIFLPPTSSVISKPSRALDASPQLSPFPRLRSEQKAAETFDDEGDLAEFRFSSDFLPLPILPPPAT